MRTLQLTAALAFVLLATAASAQQECPCVPLPPLWVVSTVNSWSSAMSTVITGNGDPLIFVLPDGTDATRWLVIRRVVGGSYTDDGKDAHQLEQFDGASSAIARLSAIDSARSPLIVTAPDGRYLVISLREPATAVKPHASRH
jgi:hypothetical protein